MNKNLQCLVDTGSSKSIISEKLARKLKLKLINQVHSTPLVSATGENLKIIGKTDLTVQIKGLSIPHTFLVAEGLFPNMLIGTDFLNKNSAFISYVDRTVRFYDNLIVVPLQGFNTVKNCVVIKNTTCIPKYSEAIISVTVPKSFKGKEAVIEPLANNQCPTLTGGSLTRITNFTGYMRVLNYKPHSVTLKRNIKIGKILYPDKIASISPFKVPQEEQNETKEQPAEILEKFITDYKIDLNPNLTSDERYQIMNLFFEFKDIFARGFKDIKVYKDYELELQLKDPSIKCYTRQYPLRKEEIIEADKQITELHKKGLVKENKDCSFNSPIFLVRKKDQGFRMVQDLRKLNSLLRPLIIALPKIDDLLREISLLKPKFLTSTDFFKGYYNIRCSPKTSHLTAFTNPRTGISYKWEVIPMGLSLSAGAFLYVMSQVFQNRERFNFLFYYVDDLAVASRDFPQHLSHLRTVFSTIRANNLTINPTKTTAAYPELEFLGYTVNSEGIKISPSKIKVIKTLQAPTNRKSLQRLLGLLQFFRKHIPNFSKQTFNMRKLLKQGTKFEWTTECNNELTQLKEALITNPILQPIREDRPIYLYIDGSTSGVGSAIVQYDDAGKPNVCSYLSYATTEAQQKWSPYELEFLALGLSLRAYETLFLQNEINVFTDNCIVLNIAKYKPLKNREKRLITYISQFRLKIRYIPGRNNKLADMLSRIPEDIESSQMKDFYPPAKQRDEEFILPLTISNQMEPLETGVETKDQDDFESKDSTVPNNPNPWITYTFESLGRAHGAKVNSQLNAEAPIFYPGYNSTVDTTAALTSSDMQEPVLRRSARIAQRRAQQDDVLPSSTPDDTIQEITAEADQGEDFISIPEQPTTNDLLSDWARKLDTTPSDEITADQIDNAINRPKIAVKDYLDDPYFGPIYDYLRNDKLTGNDEVDRKTLLIAENYYIENDLLFKISLPRGRKEQRLRPEYFQLCIPAVYTESLVREWHEVLGHFSTNRLHPTIITRYFWPSILIDIKNAVKTCDICQRSKILTNPVKAPLHPLPIPSRPGQMISFDHKVLTRKTDEGNTHILAFICHFSGYVTYVAVPDETAYTTARVFVREIVARTGPPEIILSDRGQGYMSKYFATVAKMLGIRHRTSAARASRTNGYAEQAIKRLNAGLKLYSTEEVDDRKIELILPIIEYSLRASAASNAKVSPFEICHGFPMPIPSSIDLSIPSFCSTDAESYAKWLKNSIKLLHQAVRLNRVESKEEMKVNYDMRHRTKVPQYRVGDLVLVKDTRIKPHASRVLTKKPYESGPYIIRDVIENASSGPAYKVVEMKTGKEIRNLINFDRLKAYYPQKTPGANSAGSVSILQKKSTFAPAKCIIREKMSNGTHTFLVMFADKSRHWCKSVGDGLLRDFRQRNREKC